jgi:hypothetical protein
LLPQRERKKGEEKKQREEREERSDGGMKTRKERVGKARPVSPTSTISH